MSSEVIGLLQQVMMPAFFLIGGFSWSGVLFLFIRHTGSLTRKNQFTGTGLFLIKYFSGGPRLPKIAIVIMVPVLQQWAFKKDGGRLWVVNFIFH